MTKEMQSEAEFNPKTSVIFQLCGILCNWPQTAFAADMSN